jgi:polyhydroxybutyrate depolymerase
MAHRMACDHADQITAIVSLAGATWRDPSKCVPARPVSVLQIHGTDDTVVDFHGSALHPGATDTVAQWRKSDGCLQAPTTAAPLDLVTDLAGAETTVTAYVDGCRAGTRVELWTIEGGSHVPMLSPNFASTVIDFLSNRVST